MLLHSLISGKYAQNREIGSRTVVLHILAGPNKEEQYCLPIWSIKCLDRLRIQILNCLLVASTDTILCSCITVESVDGLCDSHLGGSHCYQYQLRFSDHMWVGVPRRESKYPFASFCNLIEAASIVRYRLDSISLRFEWTRTLPTSPRPRNLCHLSSRHGPSSSSPGSLPY